MTQEDKKLFLRDLCARLPYGVKFHYTKHPQSNVDQDCDGTAIGYYCNLIVSANNKDFCVDRCKLYLRPMSSMTEEERKKYNDIVKNTIDFYDCPKSEEICFFILPIDWLNKHHFDYRGLIEKGLAIEASKGMYNIRRNNYDSYYYSFTNR